MESLEEAFAAQESQVDALLKQSSQFASALKAWKKACSEGAVNDRLKHAERATALAVKLEPAVEDVAQSWEFDAKQYLASGAWQAELIEAAGRHAGSLKLFHEGDELVCSPVVIRAEPARSSLRIGKIRSAKIRPSRVILDLVKLREQGLKQNSQEFLDHLARTVEHLKDSKQLNNTSFAKLRDIYDLFCLTPGWRKENSEAAFAQQLYALHQSDVQVTKSGKRYEFEFPTGHPKQRDLFEVVAEGGKTIRYYMIHFR